MLNVTLINKEEGTYLQIIIFLYPTRLLTDNQLEEAKLAVLTDSLADRVFNSCSKYLNIKTISH